MISPNEIRIHRYLFDIVTVRNMCSGVVTIVLHTTRIEVINELLRPNRPQSTRVFSVYNL